MKPTSWGKGFVLVSFLFSLLVSCSSGPSQDQIHAAAVALLTQQALTAQPSPTLTSTPTPAPTLTPTPVQLTLEQVRALSLQLSDLRSGYRLDAETVLDLDELRATGATRTLAYLETVQPFVGFDSVYVKGTLLDFANVRSRVLVLPSEEAASNYLQVHATLFGEEVSALQPISYDPLADESRAYFSQISGSDITADNYFVIMRKRNIVVAINYSTFANLGDLDELDQYVRTLEARLIEYFSQ